MRGMILALLLATSARAANPGDGPPPGSSQLLRAQAADYARHMMTVLRWAEEQYVRPVPRSTLADAMLAGLFEAAREPMPTGLKSEIAQAKDERQFQYLFTTARERLGDREGLRGKQAVMASLRSLPRALDPFCGIVPPNERRERTKQMQGVGLEFESLPEAVQTQRSSGDPFERPAQLDLGLPRGPARVALVIPGGPAQQAGIRPGDVLTHINDNPIETPTGSHLFPQLFVDPGPDRSPLRLTLQRPGRAEPLVRTVLPTEYKPESVFGVRRRNDNTWDFLLDRDNKIGYLRLGQIDEGSTNEMEDAITALRATGIRGLVFDLRGNPGGYVSPAQEISGMFVKSGLVATVHYRRGDKEEFRIPEGSGNGILEGIATVVLIDSETRGGGEMIAAVLQDHKVARIAGQRSFGKGSVQSTRLESAVGGLFRELNIDFKLTTGSFTRPSGRNLNRFPDSRPSDDWGVLPDAGLEYPVTPELSRQLRAWMQQQVLRPPDSRDPLPLDDPDNDPPREFARQLLVKKVKS